jgi:hypothetical protein
VPSPFVKLSGSQTDSVANESGHKIWWAGENQSDGSAEAKGTDDSWKEVIE